jgi:hypothetical protein
MEYFKKKVRLQEYGKMKVTNFDAIRATLRKTFCNVREGAGIKENL